MYKRNTHVTHGMKNRKQTNTFQNVRRDRSKKQTQGKRHNVESGHGQVKTTRSKIPNTPPEKVDPKQE